MRAGLCICVLEPHISDWCFLLCLLLLLLLLLPYHVVWIIPFLKLSSRQTRYNSSRPASLCRPLLLHARVDIAYACVLCVLCTCTSVQVCTGVCICVLEAFRFCSLCFAAAAASCPYHTVPQALNLSTTWQPRYSSSRTASLCGPPLCVC